jgi:hypothetical protein
MGIPRSIKNPAPTDTRVQESTCPKINERIREKTEASLRRAAASPGQIEQRLEKLDKEWEVERLLQANFGLVTLASLALGFFVARPWFFLTGVAAAFMGEHSIKGWCPPVPVVRRLGFRTSREINQERYALKALRGDFKSIRQAGPQRILHAADPGSSKSQELT